MNTRKVHESDIVLLREISLLWRWPKTIAELQFVSEMGQLTLVSIVFLWVATMSCSGSRILILIPFSSKSHKNTFDPMAEELAKRNHSVTYVSRYPASKHIHGIENIHLKKNKSYSEVLEPALSTNFTIYFNIGNIMRDICDYSVNDSALLSFVKEARSFDVVLVSAAFMKCSLAIARKLSPNIIIVSPPALMTDTAWALDVPTPYAYVPTLTAPYSSNMNFYQRFKNVCSAVFWLLFDHKICSIADSVVKVYFPDALPSSELAKNASLVLVNSHFSMEDPRPTMPYVIDVGAMHCRPAKRLPEEFEEFVNGSGPHGFIVFSLGSVIQSDSLPTKMVEVFTTAFALLRQRVIWKFDSPLEGVSDNVMVSKWIPQQDLMGHPKCQLAITHGGLLSLQEVVYHGVPLLGIPYGLDRDGNLFRATEQGFALTIEKDKLTVETLSEAIKQLIYNKRYRMKALEASKLLQDRPESPVESAAYWIEYVIRHKGAPHLKSGAGELNFVQYFSLDILCFLMSATVLIFLIGIFFLKLSLKVIMCRLT